MSPLTTPRADGLAHAPNTSPSSPAERPLRVGVINLMPRVETYEPSLVAALASGPVAVELVWIRLESHVYRSSDPAHLAARYVTWAEALADGPLDGLVLTGAPVEELPFASVRYWSELTAVLTHARRHVASTLGLCWGALALAALEGLAKRPLPRKLFGAFEFALTPAGASFAPAAGASMWCAQSRHAGLDEDDVARAEREGAVEVYARSEAAGTCLLATPDRRVVMHLGHPEYEPDRIAAEWARDVARGRTDVPAPSHYGPDGIAPEARWEAHSRAFFAAWIDTLALARRTARVTSEAR
jgi:homoserine O-succinyltransferase/O-acetyltransferase